MLGGEIRDPHGVEGEAQGLGFLPYSTEFQPNKRCRRAPIHSRRYPGFGLPSAA